MKKYPFPPGVTQMSGPEYAEHCNAMHAKEGAEKAARAARRAEVRKPGPAPQLRALKVGESVTLPGYRRTSQLSSAIKAAYVETGARYSSALAKSPDMLTGETMTVTGVTVTRTH